MTEKVEKPSAEQQIETLQQELQSVKTEFANAKTQHELTLNEAVAKGQRNAQFAKAYQDILAAHKINTSVTDHQAAQIEIKDGKAVGKLDYTPPKFNTGSSSSGGGSGPAENPAPSLTREEIAKMTQREINARWPEIQEVLKGDGRIA